MESYRQACWLRALPCDLDQHTRRQRHRVPQFSGSATPSGSSPSGSRQVARWHYQWISMASLASEAHAHAKRTSHWRVSCAFVAGGSNPRSGALGFSTCSPRVCRAANGATRAAANWCFMQLRVATGFGFGHLWTDWQLFRHLFVAQSPLSLTPPPVFLFDPEIAHMGCLQPPPQSVSPPPWGVLFRLGGSVSAHEHVVRPPSGVWARLVFPTPAWAGRRLPCDAARMMRNVLMWPSATRVFWRRKLSCGGTRTGRNATNWVAHPIDEQSSCEVAHEPPKL